MNPHELLDIVSVRFAALMTRRSTFFRESLKSPPVRELVETTQLEVPEIRGEGQYEVLARTAVGELDPAFDLVQWHGSDSPTLIYHHGSNERPFDYGLFSKNTFKRVVRDARGEFEANLIALRAPFHRSMRDYLRRIAHLSDFAAMFAASVRLIEHLQAWSRSRGSRCVVVSGISLGGWVTNQHRAYFNTANAYVPLLAGAALDEVFVTSEYRHMVAPSARENPRAICTALNFERDFARVMDDNVFPLLARHDRIIVFDRQKRCYEARPIAVLEKGHATATLDAKALRSHLRAVLSQAARGIEVQKRSVAHPQPMCSPPLRESTA